jgi:hypothetical protein
LDSSLFADYPPTALRVERNVCPPLHYNDAHTFMALTSGAKLGPYEILSLLGAGGMGEVYRARDTRLDRIVAVKILPAGNHPRSSSSNLCNTGSAAYQALLVGAASCGCSAHRRGAGGRLRASRRH